MKYHFNCNQTILILDIYRGGGRADEHPSGDYATNLAMLQRIGMVEPPGTTAEPHLTAKGLTFAEFLLQSREMGQTWEVT